MVLVTCRFSVSPVVGLVARTVSPGVICSIGMVLPSASSTRVPAGKLCAGWHLPAALLVAALALAARALARADASAAAFLAAASAAAFILAAFSAAALAAAAAAALAASAARSAPLMIALAHLISLRKLITALPALKMASA